MTGCNMDMYIMKRRTKMLEYDSVSASEGVSAHSNAFIVITGDFNHVSLDKTLPTFHQYVDCPTRDYNTLDLLYANAKGAYNVTCRSFLTTRLLLGV